MLMGRIVMAVAVLLVGGSLLPAHAQAVPTCFGKQATIVGTEGDDDGANAPTLWGTDQADVIVGLGGRDHINGQEGDDFYCGNSGDDYFENVDGDDQMSGGGGNDFFNEGASRGNDLLDGGSGTDLAHYEAEATVNLSTGTATGPTVGQDVIRGIEKVWAGSGSVVFIGDSGPNELAGNEGRDRVRGKGGDDVLYGDENKDTLNGGPGEDTCYGTPGFDVITNCEHIIGS
jgi:Ca2+-binding RTX toxin-like protein